MATRSNAKRLRNAALRRIEAAKDQLNGFSYDMEKNGELSLLYRVRSLEPRTVFDVGANVGKWTNAALNAFPSAEIHAFEIAPESAAAFMQQGFSSRVSLHEVGLGSATTQVKYKDYGPMSGGNTVNLRSSYLDKRHEFSLRSAQLVSGDQFCEERDIRHVDFLKIDVEGSEMAVLEGFGAMLSRRGIRLVQFEYGYNNGDVHALMRDFYDFFTSFGYVVGRISRGPICFRDWRYADNDFKSGPNYVAIHKTDEDASRVLIEA